MSPSFKEMIVVVVIAAAIFTLAKPIALRFSTEADFIRRRNVWFVLTVTAFVSPSFWLYALVAIPLMVWAGRKDTNPVAFYLLLLQVIPDVPVDIPVVGINELFALDNYRLLSLCVLIPAAWRLWRSKDPARIRRFEAMDIFLFSYGALEIALFIPPDLPGHILLHDSPTHMMRRAFLFFVDVYALYFVTSRYCASRRAVVDAQAALCLACAVMAALAIFEAGKHWLLYADFAKGWVTDPNLGVYLLRGTSLRAQASAGHSLALGYLLAIALGFWLYLKSHVTARGTRIAVTILLWIGLLAAYARGPWIGAVAIYFAFAALSPRARLIKATGIVVILAGAISMTPLGTRIMSVLPFIGGSLASESLQYREELAERSWELIKEHPYFGDQLAYTEMEDLRQGQGIIDVVNTYAGVALNKGLIGLSIFVVFILTALVKAYRATKATMQSDPDLAFLGASLVACVLGTLLMIENCSFILAYDKLFWVLAGLCAAYAHLDPAPEGRVTVKARSGGHWEPA
jgi:O-antigen ligase